MWPLLGRGKGSSLKFARLSPNCAMCQFCGRQVVSVRASLFWLFSLCFRRPVYSRYDKCCSRMALAALADPGPYLALKLLVCWGCGENFALRPARPGLIYSVRDVAWAWRLKLFRRGVGKLFLQLSCSCLPFSTSSSVIWSRSSRESTITLLPLDVSVFSESCWCILLARWTSQALTNTEDAH